MWPFVAQVMSLENLCFGLCLLLFCCGARIWLPLPPGEHSSPPPPPPQAGNKELLFSVIYYNLAGHLCCWPTLTMNQWLWVGMWNILIGLSLGHSPPHWNGSEVRAAPHKSPPQSTVRDAGLRVSKTSLYPQQPLMFPSFTEKAEFIPFHRSDTRQNIPSFRRKKDINRRQFIA